MNAPTSLHCPNALDMAAPEFDLRHLPAPEPMLLALEATDALEPGRAIQVLTPHTPLPLLELLSARGLQTLVFALPGGEARVLIRRPEHDGTPGD